MIGKPQSEIRAFIAVDLSAEMLDHLAKLSAKLQEELCRGNKSEGTGKVIRWVPAQNMHLTLKFLGNIHIKQVDRIQNKLREAVQGFVPFSLQVGKLGTFPNLNRPNVIWIGISPTPILDALYKCVEEKMHECGFTPEGRPFHPHLTLGRVGRDLNAGQMECLVNALKYSLQRDREPYDLGSFEVDAVNLYRSELNRFGAVYSREFSVQLSG